MIVAQDDCFAVFARDEEERAGAPPMEHEVVRCTSHDEARQFCQRYGDVHRRYIIRYLGPAGGGD